MAVSCTAVGAGTLLWGWRRKTGKAMGQHYQWLEANLVFHVAHQLSVRGVPAITVHDEFIVMEKDKDIAEQLMYNEWPKDLPVLAEAPWNT